MENVNGAFSDRSQRPAKSRDSLLRHYSPQPPPAEGCSVGGASNLPPLAADCPRRTVSFAKSRPKAGSPQPPAAEARTSPMARPDSAGCGPRSSS